MAKKPAPVPAPDTEAIPATDQEGRPTGPQGPVGPNDGGIDAGFAPPIEVPAEVINALGGVPIPPPPVRMPRPTVTRVGEPLAKSRPDPGGLLASPRPDRRLAMKRFDAARAALASLVRFVEGELPNVAAKIGEATEDPDVCEAEGFDPVAANALVEDLAAALAKHLD